MILQERACLADIANALELKKAVEIGTHQAFFAYEFMQRFRGTISLVDPWEIEEEFHPFFEKTSSRNQDLEIAKQKMSEFGSRVSFHRMTGTEFSKSVENESVDIVYIDGLHDHSSAQKDISDWYPKVKYGGIICGHDYNGEYPGVILAVDELRRRSGFEMHLTREYMSSWWMLKR
jgi:hypothetical protein